MPVHFLHAAAHGCSLPAQYKRCIKEEAERKRRFRARRAQAQAASKGGGWFS